jgi:YesN/AraC family two-component response regulator
MLVMGTEVLIVEDERIVAQHISYILQDEGFSICAIAADGKTAIKKIVEFQPDLILLDIQIKGEIDGIEVAEQIQSLYNIPILYLTAFSDVKTLERAQATNPMGYVLKPFRQEQLLSSIAVALATHTAQKNKPVDQASPAEKASAPYRLKPTIAYINEHLHHEINLEVLAGAIGMNSSYFSRFFRQEIGLSPYQYIIQQRIEKAKVLLLQRNILINDVALQCGFSSHSQLNQHFRRLLGITPKEYRDSNAR